MKIILTRTGGFIPVKKKAETEVSWTESDMEALKKATEPTSSETGNVRDGVYYQLQTSNEQFRIDWEKIPSKFKKTMEGLKNNLEIEKN